MLTIMERKKGESARDYVTRVLIDNIVNVHLEPGEKLLENDLSGQLGVSRTPYREAVLALAERQLVHIRPKKGTYVPYIDLKLVEEVRHLRSIVETELAVMACDLLTEEDLDVLRENIAIWKMYMERKQTDKILQYDKEFHRHFYEMCDRNYWYTLLESLSPHFDRTTVLSFRCRPSTALYPTTRSWWMRLRRGTGSGRRRPQDGICSATPRTSTRSGRHFRNILHRKGDRGLWNWQSLRQNRS